ncbi:hypothetical protein L873DRAFT_855164 [Choiromyces venosus 120613-1]|uniref:Peptidase C19 ubiquitin carboxyl-terminal hydrolase domain-containing protein n=1 Tax=Choiromyces venosus 120613-1 TaxID=1336337 RepID=A0A3N4JP99_9PEZI|nr:hypothetical protein L873DRAFT_855164 [Choiromyces venosus 120613-1]
MAAMACPTSPRPMPWEKGPKRSNAPSTSSLSSSSSSNPNAQHLPQPPIPSRTLSSVETLLSHPIKFVKAQTTSQTLTEDQTISSLGYFNKSTKRKRDSMPKRSIGPKRVKKNHPIKPLNDQGLSEDELLRSSPTLSPSVSVAEALVDKSTFKDSTRKRKQPSPGTFDGEGNNSSQVPVNQISKKPISSQQINSSLSRSLLNEDERNNLKEKNAVLESDLTTRKESKHLKHTADLIANTSDKTIVSPVLKKKSEVLSEQSSESRPNDFRVKGLMNASIFCYRNSVLQLLASSPSFVKEIIAHPNEKCYCGDGCASCALGKFYKNHFRHAGKKQILNTSLSIVARLRNALPGPIGRRRRQEDASEYMLALFNKGSARQFRAGVQSL